MSTVIFDILRYTSVYVIINFVGVIAAFVATILDIFALHSSSRSLRSFVAVAGQTITSILVYLGYYLSFIIISGQVIDNIFYIILFNSFFLSVAWQLVDLLIGGFNPQILDRYSVHRIATVSGSPKRLKRQMQYLALITAVNFIVAMILYAHFESFDFLVGSSQDFLVVLLFGLIPLIGAIASFAILSGQMIWQPFVDDTIRLKSMLFLMLQISAPVFIVFSIEVFGHRDMEHMKISGFNAIAVVSVVFVVAVALTLAAMYIGSANFIAEQSRIFRRKVELLRKCTTLAHDAHVADYAARRMALSKEMIAVQRAFSTDRIFLKYQLMAHFAKRADEAGVDHAVACALAREMFGDDGFDGGSAPVLIAHESEASDTTVSTGEDQHLLEIGQIYGAIVGELKKIGPHSNIVKSIYERNENHLRAWDLRFWLLIDLIDYIFVLADRRHDLRAIIDRGQYDVVPSSPPQRFGKLIFAALTRSFSYAVAYIGKSEGLLSQISKAFH